MTFLTLRRTALLACLALLGLAGILGGHLWLTRHAVRSVAAPDPGTRPPRGASHAAR